jgi:hypothetical protein
VKTYRWWFNHFSCCALMTRMTRIWDDLHHARSILKYSVLTKLCRKKSWQGQSGHKPGYVSVHCWQVAKPTTVWLMIFYFMCKWIDSSKAVNLRLVNVVIGRYLEKHKAEKHRATEHTRTCIEFKANLRDQNKAKRNFNCNSMETFLLWII